jgi:hypothetical protein
MLDIYGNDIGGEGGYETEEEKRRRLAAEAEATNQPVTQKITYNPDGTQKMTITGSPQALSPANPNTPTVSGPVNPLDTFGRMQQVESGNRDYNAQGQPITSPAGAMFRNQVMPSTAANPGYGIRPAAAQTPEEYNRVGQEYYQAMLRQFGGDQQKAVAAYNAGPGRVQQNMQANAGQLNPQQLPPETQGYLQKVLGPVLNAVVPSAQAAPAPQPASAVPVNAQAQAQAIQNKQGLNFANANIPAPQPAPAAPVSPTAPPAAAAPAEPMGPSTTAMTPEAWAERLNTARQDDRQLASLAYDPNIPQYIREEASADMYKRLQAAKNETATKAKLQEGIASGDMSEINRIMKRGGEEGSWMKYLFFGLLGSDAAKIERQKLFPDEGSKVVAFTGVDGRQGLIRQAADGSPLFGRFDDGKELDSKQLIQYATGGGKLGKGTSLSSEVYVDTTTGNRYRSGYDTAGNTALVNVQGGAPFRGNPKNLEVQSIGTAISKAEGTKAVELRYTGPIAYTKAGADAAGEFNFKHGTNIGYQSQQPGAPLVDLNTGRPVVPNSNGTITATTGGGAAVTAGAPGAPGTAGKTPADIQGEFDANKKIRESVAKNQQQVKQIYPFINTIKGLIDKSTSSGIGSLVDEAGNWFGYSTDGADAIAAIKPLANKVLMGVERFEGPQSDLDVKSYKEAAGQLADPKVPASQKQAAFNTIIEIMKRNAPELDWSAYGTAEDNSPAAKAKRELEKRKK